MDEWLAHELEDKPVTAEEEMALLAEISCKRPDLDTYDDNVTDERIHFITEGLVLPTGFTRRRNGRMPVATHCS